MATDSIEQATRLMSDTVNDFLLHTVFAGESNKLLAKEISKLDEKQLQEVIDVAEGEHETYADLLAALAHVQAEAADVLPDFVNESITSGMQALGYRVRFLAGVRACTQLRVSDLRCRANRSVMESQS